MASQLPWETSLSFVELPLESLLFDSGLKQTEAESNGAFWIVLVHLEQWKSGKRDLSQNFFLKNPRKPLIEYTILFGMLTHQTSPAAGERLWGFVRALVQTHSVNTWLWCWTCCNKWTAYIQHRIRPPPGEPQWNSAIDANMSDSRRLPLSQTHGKMCKVGYPRAFLSILGPLSWSPGVQNTTLFPPAMVCCAWAHMIPADKSHIC